MRQVMQRLAMRMKTDLTKQTMMNTSGQRVANATQPHSKSLQQVLGSNPRFEQIDISAQPRPPSAMEYIAKQPIIKSKSRVVACDGGHSGLGHQKVYINLDKGVNKCRYCGLRFDREHDHHH
ncbi:hypothetical protein MP228_012665 [Amoeboaphelidium protococcarum]|nr:hypothetical protein MP228_012665 [Amoeboaphelidium protococcarum]